jgi:hypothetical protein
MLSVEFICELIFRIDLSDFGVKLTRNQTYLTQPNQKINIKVSRIHMYIRTYIRSTDKFISRIM